MIIACSTTTLSRSLCISMQTFSASWQLMLSLSAAATPVKMHRNLGSWQSKRLYWRSCAVTSLRSNVSLVCQVCLHFQHSCNFKHCSMSWGALVYDSDSQISCTFGHNRPSVKPLLLFRAHTIHCSMTKSGNKPTQNRLVRGRQWKLHLQHWSATGDCSVYFACFINTVWRTLRSLCGQLVQTNSASF